MVKNIGTVDRALRILLGVVLLAAPFVSGMALFAAGWATALSVVVGLVMLGTATLRFCPLYTLVGVRTCKVS
jgi:hypothetical protein